jgi:hypothetical protein
MPCPSAPIVTAASPVRMPTLEIGGADLVSEPGHRGGHLQGSPYGSLGVVLERRRRPPHRHHRVADELLDHPPVASDQLSGLLEVPGEQLADLLGVALL